LVQEKREEQMRIGARGSDLAQWQAHWVGDRLTKAGIPVEQVIIKTHGDRVQDKPLHQLGVQGAFTKEIEEALLDGRIDLAVHSFKDMALKQPAGLEIVALSERADPSDLLIVHCDSVEEAGKAFPLAEGAVVGTSAVRRGSQLRALRPDVDLRDLRGNVPTRLDKLRRGDYDAIFLAAAGIERLGLDLTEFHVVRLDPWEFIPSPAQGVLAVEMRADDSAVGEVVKAVHHEESGRLANAERMLLRGFGGGCSLPLGGHARLSGGSWELKGFWGGDGGPRWETVTGEQPDTLADRLIQRLTGEAQ
jgi:hydroxymethylbilane synthase